MGSPDSAPTTRERFYEVVRAIPAGRVSTYGDVARMAGKPNGAREVGWALSSLPPESDVPWWRVVNAHGQIPYRPHAAALQAELLRDEGIEVDGEGKLSLSRYRWLPGE
jgi:methylated-DNA-protein-cysteine methyltransferase-like protein